MLRAILVLCSFVGTDTLIQEGEYHQEVFLLSEGLLMTGGQVDHMILWGDGPYEIEGGELGLVELETGDIAVSGGTVDLIARSEARSGGSRTAIEFVGHYFRVHDQGLSEYNTYIVEGWLQDGSFISLDILNNLEWNTRSLPLTFSIVDSISPPGDANLDWRVDLTDLNDVRNNFGTEGPGDADFDGDVDLSDLNLVRNNFGTGDFTLIPGGPISYYEVTTSAVVPEPASILLVMVVIIMAFIIFGDRK